MGMIDDETGEGFCEVCLNTWADITVTFALPDKEPLPVLFCKVCATDVFVRMSERYVAAVEQSNADVAAVKKVLGIKEKP